MTYALRTIPCETCGGAGDHWHEYPTYAVRTECPDCTDGVIDRTCDGCGLVAALNDDFLCERCEDSRTLSIAEFDEKYGLTEVRGDPLKEAA